jgi:polysaccharide export outer membrane protein
VFLAPYPEYRIGPQDLVEIDVYEAPEFRRTVRVSQDGTVRLPLCKDPIELAGLTYVEGEAAVARSLVEEGLLVDPIVALHVREPHGNPVHVTGSVRQPVVFPAVGPTTLLDAIAQAGGLNAPGPEIVITRPAGQGRSEETIRIPAAEFREGLNGAQSVPLYGGETVRVVAPEKAFLMGAVGSAGAIEITDPDGMEFLKVLASAGGLQKESNNKAIILRGNDISPTERERIEVDVKKILKFEVFDVRIQPGDVVYFPTSRGKQFMYRMAEAAAFQVVWQGMGFLWR